MFVINNKFQKILKHLKLDKPLVIFDVETTGLSISTDKIVELFYIKIFANGAIKENDIFFNPEMKVTPEASAVHGITNSQLADKPKFKDKAQELWEVFYDSYYGGFNIKSFDLPILRREFIRVGMDFDYSSRFVIDAKEIYRYMVPRTLASAYEYYCRKELKAGHTAPLNTQVAADIMLKQLEKYKEVRDMDFIENIYHRDEDAFVDKDRKFYWHRGKTYFGFSKYKNREVAEIAKLDPKFMEWVLAAEFSDETKSIIRKAMNGKIIGRDN